MGSEMCIRDRVTVEEEEDFTPAKLQEIQDTYQPEQIFIEYNGTWGMDKLLEAKMPEGWVIVQSLATVDSTTYDLYMNNMRAMMQEQVFSSDVVIFNRTDDDTDRGHLRRTIKNINRKAKSVYAIQALLPVAWRITNSVPSIRTIPMGRAIIPVIPKCTRRPAIR